MTINPKFKIGELVAIKTDSEGLKRQVIGYQVSGNGILYIVQQCDLTTYHFGYELTPYSEALAGLN